MDAISECMKMTSFGGESKSLSLQAIKLAREGNFKKSEEVLKEAEHYLDQSHEAHAALLGYDAEHEDLRVTIFMVHAADHLNSAEIVFTLGHEIINLYKEK